MIPCQLQRAEILGRTKAIYIGIKARTPCPWRIQYLWQRDGKWWWWWMLWDCRFPLVSEAHCTAEVKHEQTMAWVGSILRGPPMWLNSWHIDHILRWSWLTWVNSFGKRMGSLWQRGFCDFGTQEWAWHLWEALQVLTETSRGKAWEMPFWKCEDLEASRGPIWVTQMQICMNLCRGIL